MSEPSDRQFWIEIRRALLIALKAIERRYLEGATEPSQRR
jgi:hypothetical protein